MNSHEESGDVGSLFGCHGFLAETKKSKRAEELEVKRPSTGISWIAKHETWTLETYLIVQVTSMITITTNMQLVLHSSKSSSESCLPLQVHVELHDLTK